MKVYRIAKTRYIKDLTGIGARIFGGRWNHKGSSIIYASESRALATVEFLVHVPLSLVPTDLALATLQIPDEITPSEILVSDLPANWHDYPAPSKLAELGSNWVARSESLLLRVPSAVVEHEFNILINPMHLDMKHVFISQTESFEFDKRLLR